MYPPNENETRSSQQKPEGTRSEIKCQDDAERCLEECQLPSIKSNQTRLLTAERTVKKVKECSLTDPLCSVEVMVEMC